MPVKGLTQTEIEEATRAQVASGAKSTDRTNRLPGETATEANARITAAYKEMTAKPILSQEQIDGGMKVQFVRTSSGGAGEYTAIKPLGYTGPTKIEEFTPGVIPANSKYTTGTSVGFNPDDYKDDADRQRIAAKLASGKTLTADEQAFLNKGTAPVTPSSTTKTVNPVVAVPPVNKTEVSRVDNGDGTFTVTYSDKTTAVVGTKKVVSNTDVNPTKTLVSTNVDNKTGNTIGYFSDGSQEILNQGTGPVRSQEFTDAYALLEATFRSYGLESLVPAIKGFMERDLGPEQAGLELRTAPEYIARFKGNQLRLAAGKNALREDIYLATERAYDETLTSYGQANYFGIDRQSKQAKMAEIIGNDISADEFKSRVDLAVARVTNADPSIKKLLKDFYPTINDADLVGYFLNPAEGLPKLTEKVTSAEIGSAFLGQGLAYTQQKSTELAQYGIDRAGALKGAAEIKEVLPDSQKLSDIYGESNIKYTQQTAEDEFLKNNQDAATKRKRLASMERASFSGSAGRLASQDKTAGLI